MCLSRVYLLHVGPSSGMSFAVTNCARNHLPSTWSRRYPDTPGCIQLGTYTEEYRKVCQQFKSTLTVEPSKIERVENHFLFGMYQLKKEERSATQPLTKELDLWHATSISNFENIVQTNLDWRRATRCKFGQGVSFSSSAKYANDQCNRANPRERVSIRCKVLVGRTEEGWYGTGLPSSGMDTTMGNGTMVYVKYADYEFYPEYAVYYRG